jgi:RNA-directed DNA polymerase
MLDDAVAKEDQGRRFFSIAHFLTPEALYEAFLSLRKDASAGVDRVTCKDYEEQAQQKVQELHGRLKSKTYQALPLRRIYIPKEDEKRDRSRFRHTAHNAPHSVCVWDDRCR